MLSKTGMRLHLFIFFSVFLILHLPQIWSNLTVSCAPHSTLPPPWLGKIPNYRMAHEMKGYQLTAPLRFLNHSDGRQLDMQPFMLYFNVIKTVLIPFRFLPSICSAHFHEIGVEKNEKNKSRFSRHTRDYQIHMFGDYSTATSSQSLKRKWEENKKHNSEFMEVMLHYAQTTFNFISRFHTN